MCGSVYDWYGRFEYTVLLRVHGYVLWNMVKLVYVIELQDVDGREDYV